MVKFQICITIKSHISFDMKSHNKDIVLISKLIAISSHFNLKNWFRIELTRCKQELTGLTNSISYYEGKR